MNNQVLIESKKKKMETLISKYPNFEIIDITSNSQNPWIKFSPFYPLGNIPIPFSESKFSKSVEGIWQGLKVFEKFDIDTTKFDIENMKNIKRTIRKYGKIKGHKKGVNGKEILNYSDSKKMIYLPSYKWVLDNKLKNEINELKKILVHKPILLLDYETSEDIFSLKPISHAFLVKLYLEDNYPNCSNKTNGN
ncbi:hypothetical protein V3471_14970 [Flavobacterium oreochromis]|uniref:DUF6939 family protein n=1 Tax=Flavobacterium oreochromis TaxID=2906078 RepID=UPI000CDA4B6C|nr:hypothetical protein [Flavobacterium oreochromis]POR17771.1 hypothetical protein BWK58_14905 [Flavobacterium columnare]QYS87253.1 hypothetical protein JJC03_04790 [Flavobacterium oreochromis]